MNNLKSALDASIDAILAKLPLAGKAEFDTHDFITVFQNLNERIYANLFVRHKDAKGAFKSFHGTIARYMNSLEKRGLIAKVMVGGEKKRVRSLNIKSNMTSNQVWIKL